MIEDVNATVETTFLFGLFRANVNYVLNNKSPINKQHLNIVRFSGDTLFYNMTGCDQPDRTLLAIFKYSAVAFLCLLGFSLQLTFVAPFYKMTKKNGPSFFLLLNLLLCSMLNIIFTQFLIYFEAAIGFRLPIPFDLDYYIRLPFWRAEHLFYFIFAFNRCACLLFPFKYNRVFSRRNIFWIIFWAWIYSFLEVTESQLANNGMHRVHCLAPDDELDSQFQTHDTIRHPYMVVIELASQHIYALIWYGPALMDCVTLAKLVHDRIIFRLKWPFIVIRPIVLNHIAGAKNERIRLFFVCFCNSVFHLIFAIIFFFNFTSVLFFNRITCKWPRTFYNLFYIVDNSILYILLLAMSRDIRKNWLEKNKKFFGIPKIKWIASKIKWIFSICCHRINNRIQQTPNANSS